jgi:DNA-binding CsgD family transcriptional regulator
LENLTDTSPSSQPDTEGLRLLTLLLQRGLPELFTADRNCTTIFSSSGLVDSPLLAKSVHVLEMLLKRGETLTSMSFVRVDEHVMLRIVPLFGAATSIDRYVVFIELQHSRNSLAAAVIRHGITKREADVLELLVSGFSTAQIAERLFIATSTAIEHVNSLFRKTDTNKRAELVARVYQYEHDSPRTTRTPSPNPQEDA